MAASRLRSLVYDMLVVPRTARWYAAALARIPRGARVLDVGIGTGAALAAHADAVRANGFAVVGVDVDADYLARCRATLAAAGLAAAVELRRTPFEAVADGPYDAIYFAGSFMLLDDPPAALAHARGLLSARGVVLFTQTIVSRRSRLLEALKPRLHRLTSVRFGRVTYEGEFRALLERAGFRVPVFEPIPRGGRGARLVLAVPDDRAPHPRVTC